MDLSQFSDEQLMQAAGVGQKPQGDLSQFSDEDLAKVAGIALKPQAPGFLSRVGDDINSRYQRAKQDTHNYPEMAPVIGAGLATGAVNDITNNAINAAVPDFVKQGLATGAHDVSGALNNTSGGQALGDVLLKTKDAYENFMKSNPRTAIGLRTAGNIASFIPTERAAEAVASGTSNAFKGAQGLADAYAEKYPAGSGPLDTIETKLKTPIGADMVKTASTNAYQAVKDSGTVLTPQFTDKALDIVNSGKQKALFGGKVLTKEQADINAALADYEPARGQHMTMEDLQGLDSTLGDKAAQAYVSGNANKGRVIGDLQSKLRLSIQPKNLAQGDVIGSPEGVDILMNHAVPLWSTQAKMQDLEKIIENANNTPNPSTAIQTGFRTLMRNNNKFSQYPAEVQKIIAKTAKSGIADDLLGVIGSRLNQVAGAAIGGPQGYVASTAISMTGRGLRTALKNNTANSALDAMVEPLRPSIQKYLDYASPNIAAAPVASAAPLTIEQIMKLPPGQAKALLKALPPR